MRDFTKKYFHLNSSAVYNSSAKNYANRNLYISLQNTENKKFEMIILPVEITAIVMKTMLEKLNNALIIIYRLKCKKSISTKYLSDLLFYQFTRNSSVK